MKRRPTATEIHGVDTSYRDIPDHCGKEVTIEGWSSDYVMLVIRAETRVCEAIISPAQLRELADKAEAEAHKW
jgi:hypothetical protein